MPGKKSSTSKSGKSSSSGKKSSSGSKSNSGSKSGSSSKSSTGKKSTASQNKPASTSKASGNAKAGTTSSKATTKATTGNAGKLTGASKSAIAANIKKANAAKKAQSTSSGNAGKLTGASKSAIAANIKKANQANKKTTQSASNKPTVTMTNPPKAVMTNPPLIKPTTSAAVGQGVNNLDTQIKIPKSELTDIEKTEQFIKNMYDVLKFADGGKSIAQGLKFADELSRRRKLKTFLESFQIKGFSSRAKFISKIGVLYDIVKAVSETALANKVLDPKAVAQGISNVLTMIKADKKDWKQFGELLNQALSSLINDPALRKKAWEGIMSGEAFKEGMEWNKLLLTSISQAIYNFSKSQFDKFGIYDLYDDLFKLETGKSIYGNLTGGVSNLFNKLDGKINAFLNSQLLPVQSSVESKLTTPAPATVTIQKVDIQAYTPSPVKPTAPDAMELKDYINSLK